MLIKLKNKDTLIFDDFKFKCCVGKKGIKKNKFEGDKSTPRGTFELGTLYYRADKIVRPITSLKTKIIKRSMGWCNDSNNKFYNREIKKNKFIKHEKLYRSDFKYDVFLVVYYNYKKPVHNGGSAIFVHLTKNYKPTAGCIALNKKDFLILLKLINKKTKIEII